MRQRVVNYYERGDIFSDAKGGEWEVIGISRGGGPVIKSRSDGHEIGYGHPPFADEDTWVYVSGEFSLDTVETRLLNLMTSHGDGFEFPRLAPSDARYFAKEVQRYYDR